MGTKLAPGSGMLDYQRWSFEIACPEKGARVTHDPSKTHLGESPEPVVHEWESVQPPHEAPETPPTQPSPEHAPDKPQAPEPEEAPYEEEKTHVELPHIEPPSDPRKTVASKKRPGRRNAT